VRRTEPRTILAALAIAAAMVTTAAADEAGPKPAMPAPAPPAQLAASPDKASDKPATPERADTPPVSAPSLAALPASTPGGRNLYLPVIQREAKQRGLPPEVADAVARVESAYEPSAIGAAGERGLMQVMPPTATMLGFKGNPAELADPETNIRYGVEYLAGAWKLANGDLCRALMKYRAGHNEERMSPLSVEYCRRARMHLAAIGSPLADGTLPAPNFFPGASGAVRSAAAPPVRPAPPRRLAGRLKHGAPVRTASAGAKIWAAHMDRIRAIEARLPWRRGGIMSPG
jgi:soluble lytic murein transglycosylase-like protein